MNATISIFVSDERFFSSYPNDYSKDIFKGFIDNSKNLAQIHVHRNGQLMYYGYTQKINKKSPFTLGVCILLNGSMFLEFGKLFSLFENVVSDMLVRLELVTLKSDGDFELNHKQLFEKKSEIDRLCLVVSSELESLKIGTSNLPSQNLSINNQKITTYPYNAQDENSLVRESFKGENMIVVKRSSESSSVSAIKNIISELNGKINKLTDSYNQLKKEKARLVIAAFVPWILILIGVGLSYHEYKLNSESTAQSLRENIEELNDKVIDKNNRIKELNNKLVFTNAEKDSLKSALSANTVSLDSTKHLADSLIYLSDSLNKIVMILQAESSRESLSEEKRQNSYSSSNYPIFVNNPSCDKAKTTETTIQRIALYENKTLITLRYKCSDSGRLYISPETYIFCNGSRKKIKNSSGIDIYPKYRHASYGDIVNFTLEFEGLPADIKYISLIEPDSPWQWFSIRLQ